MKSILVGGVAAIAMAGAAHAADLRVARGPAAAAIVATAPSWTGFYAGGHVGYGGGWNVANPLGWVNGAGGILQLGGKGVFGGVQAGFDWQIDRLVAGVVADVSFGNIGLRTNTGLGSEQETWLRTMGSVRGRIGFLATPDLLLYGTAGLAIGQRRYAFLDISGLNGGSFAVNRTMVGWTAGVGAEYRFASNWSLFAEYRYTDLGSKGNTIVINNDSPMATRVHLGMVGFNYRFSTGPSAVVARY